MIKEDKELLLRYLCMALPYKVKVCLYEQETCILLGIDGPDVYLDVDSDPFRIESIRPYLRPMSNMTEEEEEEYNILCNYNNNEQNATILIDWLLKKRFDYMGLIPKGLALEVTEKNNPYK